MQTIVILFNRLFILLVVCTQFCLGQEKEATDSTKSEKFSESWGAISPGKGFEVAKTKYGNLNISAYMLGRYMNQLPAKDTLYSDHLGRERTIDPRQDIL